MQPAEKDGQLFVIIQDITYDSGEGDEEEESEKYRVSLEKEFNVTFENVNIGPSVDIPAFLTTIATTMVPLWSVILGAFFLGKPIKENLDAWCEIGHRVREFFAHPVVLSKRGASVIAVEAILEEMDRAPKSIQLLSYRSILYGDKAKLRSLETSSEISETPETLLLGFVLHVFEIEADGQKYRVGVNGQDTDIIEIE
ncbi:hypothetical protein HBA54_07535 [Pelagibius litoralis]|uniref:Uncharacterized protein n=1 Tax=Pelagibius litoralis TaxID=374515 RepID=A0A967C863_9PROT|nr:hypothetical protein [Pelagibius litoralis]NIA68442.1 hypothetical protein [Pelagibius litoralis]